MANHVVKLTYDGANVSISQMPVLQHGDSVAFEAVDASGKQLTPFITFPDGNPFSVDDQPKPLVIKDSNPRKVVMGSKVHSDVFKCGILGANSLPVSAPPGVNGNLPHPGGH